MHYIQMVDAIRNRLEMAFRKNTEGGKIFYLPFWKFYKTSQRQAISFQRLATSMNSLKGLRCAVGMSTKLAFVLKTTRKCLPYES